MGINERLAAVEVRQVLLLLAFLFHLMYGNPGCFNVPLEPWVFQRAACRIIGSFIITVL